jgi:dipeptidyl aminopeptidase/acylaminoacyl peptidase
MTNRDVMETGNFSKPERLIPLLGGKLEDKADVARKLSPLDLVKKDSPAIFVAHGDADKTLSVKNATILRDVATAKGARVECVISHGAGHGFQGQDISPSVEEIAQKTTEFFLKYLLPDKK